MHFFSGYTTHFVCNEITIQASPVEIWNEITNVKIEAFKFPRIYSLLGIPKPLSAEVKKEGVGGYRVATFSNGAEFHQDILEWDLHKKYRFRFNPTSNFKVGYIMNLAKGPFEIVTGGYDLYQDEKSVRLVLSSNYTLHGVVGKLMHLPYRLVVYLFQIYLLKGIKKNSANRKQ